MKATLLHKNIPVARIKISFLVRASHIETSIIQIWLNGHKATKRKIVEEIQNMFYSGGLDGCANWVNNDDRDEYSEKAKEHAKKLFPTFYKNY